MTRKIQAFFIISTCAVVAVAVGFVAGGAASLIPPSRGAGGGCETSVSSSGSQECDSTSSTIENTHRSTSMDPNSYDVFYQAALLAEKVKERVVSGIIPHHLVAGKYLAAYFNQLSDQQPEVVVLIGPNHPQAGRNNFVTSLYNWRTPYGTLKVSKELVEKLVSQTSPNLSFAKERETSPLASADRRPSEEGERVRGEVSLVTIDEKIIDTEHAIGADVPFIKKTWPNATFIPIIIKNNATNEQVRSVVAKLAELLPKNSLLLASVDFSHYLPEPVANFHDELSRNILATGDLSRVSKLEIDSQPSIRFLLEYNKLKSSQNFHEVFHTNSATIIGKPDIAETTSHILGYYTTSQTSPSLSFAKERETSPLTTLQFFGDIMLDRNVAKAMGKDGLDYIFKNLRGQENRFFQGVDMFIANLEGPFAPTRAPTSKSIAFRFDPTLTKQLKKYNFAGFSLANNHSYDMGRANVTFTRETLRQAGFGYFGDELNEGPELTWIKNDIAYIGLHNTYHELDLKKEEQTLLDAKSKARYVIVNVHWGEEYKRISNKKQRDLAHWLIDHGATAVIGHHPHVVEEMEIYKDAPIFYSLGNFIFDQYFSQDTQEGLSVGLTLQDGRVKGIYLFPFFGVKSQVQLMSGQRWADFLKWMGENSRLDGRKLENGQLSL